MKKEILLIALIGITFSISAQPLPISGNNYHYYGPTRQDWGYAYLQVGGDGRKVTDASVVTTNGNLHLDSKDGANFGTYINYYSKGNTIINYSQGNVGIGTADPKDKLDVNGNIRILAPSVTGDASKRDILFDFSTSGGTSAIIRSFRGGSYDSNIQFLTNSDGVHENSPQVRMHINDEGNVGIGTTDPKDKLDVNGNIRILAPSVTGDASKRDILFDFSASGGTSSIIRSNRDGSYGTNLQFFTTFTSLNALPELRMIIDYWGNVGIGKNPNGYKLDVCGTIHANEIKIDATCADFVFDQTYNLRSLNDVENFVKTNKHLPEIASAKEMQENGVSVSEMQGKLLQKVEELTLYTIEQNKKNELQTKQIQAISEQNELLKHQIELLMKNK